MFIHGSLRSAGNLTCPSRPAEDFSRSPIEPQPDSHDSRRHNGERTQKRGTRGPVHVLLGVAVEHVEDLEKPADLTTTRKRYALVYPHIKKGDVILPASADRFGKNSNGPVIERRRERTAKGLAGLVPEERRYPQPPRRFDRRMQFRGPDAKDMTPTVIGVYEIVGVTGSAFARTIWPKYTLA